jgi:hypothetical protein
MADAFGGEGGGQEQVAKTAKSAVLLTVVPSDTIKTGLKLAKI